MPCDPWNTFSHTPRFSLSHLSHPLFGLTPLSFFQDGWKAAQSLSPFIEKLAASVHVVSGASAWGPWSSPVFLGECEGVEGPAPAQLGRGRAPGPSLADSEVLLPVPQLRQAQEEELQKLTRLRDSLRGTLQLESREVSP